MPVSKDDDTKVDEAKMDGLLKKLLSTPPKPHKKKDAGISPDASHSRQDDSEKLSGGGKNGGKAKQARR